MAETQQGMRKAQEREILPAVDLFPQVEYDGRTIDAAVFGPGTHSKNLVRMKKEYFHSKDLPKVTFRPLTTAESLAVAGYDFRNLAKPQIFDSYWLQAGHVLMTSGGVWINPLRDDNGSINMDEEELEQRLGEANRVNEIYLLDDDTSFVPYDSFERGIQENTRFFEGGLARGLVHTADKKAATLSSIANKDLYPHGVGVWAFEPVQSPTLRVIRLDSFRGVFGVRLDVGGYCWNEGDYGCAFGGLVSGEASAPRKFNQIY